MSTIYRFEDLPLWQQSRSLCNRIFRMIEQSPLFKSDFKFRDQLRASAGSVMDNIAEGFERSSRLEFVNFLGIAKGSTGEVRSQVYRAMDNKYIDHIDGIAIIDEYEKLAKEMAGFISYLNKSTVKGQKFKDRYPGS
ncbi:four helix bundle protein [Agriterribacter sp.]|uniref:four helix bundle protein n=1 Tax=Agriterribacter sp. TaxID=2821509 RepID=UPI002B6FFCF8|nr:four helix bundle protein [Agriterribacter sp.]HRO47835.1 four helix bundle protein [Agriterribacter sp.]HRQ15858.1 four helix bundle protein [Agriterribacter sp.]